MNSHSQARYEALLSRAHRIVQLAAAEAEASSRVGAANDLTDMATMLQTLLLEQLQSGRSLRTRPRHPRGRR